MTTQILPKARDPYVAPSDLKRWIQRREVNCFLCGPGQQDPRFEIRQQVQMFLTGFPATTVTLGEDILLPGRPTRRSPLSRLDLQTAESIEASEADFTILMLETPGAIAELGSFAMLPGLRSRLYVLVSKQYYGNASYISRGPLSLISKDHSLGVIYYDPNDIAGLLERVSYPLMFHKFAQGDLEYRRSLRSLDKDGTMESHVHRLRESFLPQLLLSTISILGTPQLTELMAKLFIRGDELTQALRVLHRSGAISRNEFRYKMASGFRHPLFNLFDTSNLSLKRCEMVATR